MDIPEKRRTVEGYLRRITIHKEFVDIDLANLPLLSEMMAKGPPIPDGGRAMGEGTGVRFRGGGATAALPGPPPARTDKARNRQAAAPPKPPPPGGPPRDGRP